jgi:Rab5 GDP/GTP exchange factor
MADQATMSPSGPTAKTAMAEGEAGAQPLVDISDNSEDSRSRAQDIEKEASEHLARRAAEMHIDEPVTSSNGTEKTELPASPPPPAPPAKDGGPESKEAAEAEYDEKHPPNEELSQDVPEAPQGTTETAGAEIQNIMHQFENGLGGGEQEIMSPRLERQQPVLVLPPRSSSLEAREYSPLSPQTTGQSLLSQRSIDRPNMAADAPSAQFNKARSDDTESIASTRAGSIFQPPPPSPEPEASLPFDFHRFLEQLRHRTADPVARFLRSFLIEFGKKQWMVHEQVKIISDFLEFISKKMAQCEVWRTVSDAEFDNAREGMEKLVMNRLYNQTFSPAIPPPTGSPRKGGKGTRSQADVASPHGPGRRGQHQEDVERDGVIAQKIRIYGWIREQHLDVKPIGDKGKKFLGLAQQELLKINTYRAPRDKVICVLNCCKVIFGFLKNAKADQSADAFVPLLIYTVLQARPEHLVSNVQYIWRFRNQDKLGGEAGYYMSSLMGVVAFIENLDRTNLTITDEEFERNVEQAVSAIAEKNKEQEYEERAHSTATSTRPMQHLSEKSALSRAEVTPRNSQEAERASPRRNASQRLSEKTQQSAGAMSDDDDMDAVTGLLRTIQKPLSSIGRIFSDDNTSTLKPASTPQSGSTSRGLSPAPRVDSRPNAELQRKKSQQRTAEDAAARQASAEAAQAQRVRVREHKVVVE